MNGAHWHLVTNHLPIIIPLMGIVIMVGGILFKSEILKRAAYSIFILGSLSAIVAFSTGEGAEEIVEKIQGMDEQFIKTHEEAAETFAILLYVLGMISVIGLWANWKKKSFSNTISIAALTFAIITLYSAKETGTTGGEIRHTEIRADSANSGNNANQNSEQEEDDDD
ncbi:MAG: hypothetical protein RIC03_04410 [Cyclobacteriaceae bacterium]